MAVFRDKVTVRLQHTDAAGVLFFANHIVLAHETYEKFMEQIDCSFASILDEEPFLVLIIHAEADFRRPVAVGDRIDVEMRIIDIGNTSFILEYRLNASDGSEISRCKTVHVATDKDSGKKIPLPTKLRTKLESFRDQP